MNLWNVFLAQLRDFFLKLLVTIPVAPIITGIIVHFRFHIRCISVPKLLYFNVFPASSAGIATSISVIMMMIMIMMMMIIIIIIIIIIVFVVIFLIVSPY